jgi:hypothetical protein
LFGQQKTLIGEPKQGLIVHWMVQMSHPANYARQLVHNTSGLRTQLRRSEASVLGYLNIAVHSGVHFTRTHGGVNEARLPGP